MSKTFKLILLFISISTFATTRVKNPCWNTSLSEEEVSVCTTCTAAVSAIVKDESLSPCKKEKNAVAQCFADFDNCPNYNEILIQKDNCSTSLVKACFYNL